MKWLIIVYSCLKKGKDRIEKTVFEKYQIRNASVIVLSGIITNHCFNDNENFDGEIIFEKDNDLEDAKQMCSEIGTSLYGESNKYGFLNSGQLLIFSHKTPNNSLPILWKRGSYKGKEWIPLFPRPEEI